MLRLIKEVFINLISDQYSHGLHTSHLCIVQIYVMEAITLWMILPIKYCSK